MNWKTLVPVTLPVKVPHSAAGNKNKISQESNCLEQYTSPSGFRIPLSCNRALATVNLQQCICNSESLRQPKFGQLLSMHVMPRC